MATITGRSILRSSLLRTAAAKITGAARPSAFRLPKQRPAVSTSSATRFLRLPVELSCCVESLLPMHSAVASARMTSMFSVSGDDCGWLPFLHRTFCVSIS